MKYIIVPALLFVLVFGNSGQVFAQMPMGGEEYKETVFEKIKGILSSIEDIFSESLAQMTGSYATVAGDVLERPVTADFSVVAYYPNLKSKIGLASNIKVGVPLETAIALLKPIGPGAICNNIEFDQWLRWSGGSPKNSGDAPQKGVSPSEVDNPALQEFLSSSTNAFSRPIRTMEIPTKWLSQYEQKVGDSNMSIVLQLTGPAPQFQIPASRYSDLARHPVPTNIQASANYTARFTAAANHSYPIMWSLWNEPGHTLMSVSRGRYADGSVMPGCALDASGKVTDVNCEKRLDYQTRRQQAHDKSAAVFADMYNKYDAAMRPEIGNLSSLGGASFLAADFSSKEERLSADDGAVYLKEYLNKSNALPGPRASSNFFSFNSFGGKFDLVMNEARSVLGTQSVGSLGASVPFIFTQYAPGSLKVNDDAVTALKAPKIPIMQVATDELTDLVKFQEATDLQFACHSYWVGGVSSVFLQDKANPASLTASARFSALKMFAELPIMRVPLNIDNTRVKNSGVMGLAGINPTTAAVLLWNNSTTTFTSVPLREINIPASISKGVTTLQILDSSNSVPRLVTYTAGDTIKLPPNSVALLKTQIAGLDPLARRSSLGVDVKFLKTQVSTDRIVTACAPGDEIPGVIGCAKNTGTYGFYDSVRSVAYLGTATTSGARNPETRAVYQSIPAKLYVNLNIYNQDVSLASFGSGSVTVSLKFPNCPNRVVTISTDTDTLFKRGGGVIDLAANNVPEGCYKKSPTEIIFATSGLMPGAQAEIYLSASSIESENMRQQTNQMRNTDAASSSLPLR